LVGGSSFGNKSTATNSTWSLVNWVEGSQYVVYRAVQVTSGGAPITVKAHPGVSGYTYLNGIQIAAAAPAAPTIAVQPVNQNVFVGQTVTFSVSANGSAPLNYQWTFQGVNIAGQTDSSLVLTNVQLSQTGNYAVQVTNLYGSIISSNATLTINFPPAAVQVVNTTNSSGGAVVVPVVIVANGNENASGFSLNFDPSRLTFVSLTPGDGATGATFLVNSSQTGKLGVALSLPSGTTFAAGA
jgi:hypothetical protein